MPDNVDQYGFILNLRKKSGVINNLPKMTVRILEISCITAPKSIGSRLNDSCTRIISMLHHEIHFFFTAYIMSDCKFGCGRMLQPDTRVMCYTLPWPNCQLYTALKIKERYCAMLKLLPYNSVRR